MRSNAPSMIGPIFDSLVVNAGRLRILAALAGGNRREFNALRKETRLTDGNLASHAKRLRAGGLIEVEKRFRDGKPVTSFALTPAGRDALEGHINCLMHAIRPPPERDATPAAVDEDWID